MLCYIVIKVTPHYISYNKYASDPDGQKHEVLHNSVTICLVMPGLPSVQMLIQLWIN